MLHSTRCFKPQAKFINNLAKNGFETFIHSGSHGVGVWEKICCKGTCESNCAMSSPTKKEKRKKEGDEVECSCPLSQHFRHNRLMSNHKLENQIAGTGQAAASATEKRGIDTDQDYFI